ncbi:PASTA domain-containing protein [Subtercola sp. RTI3]|uniref:PASTA domain-containing protein n=1 Tax=Subtercola sp. RTI3 TaxID=3048639 RepID=UPI002B23CC02|nr:PASTA domain-containing protein [Subtercola sp. RTI3]MEA9986798.1 PASTA domain-containing protein [Subtercola sp. RTI3]
MTGNTPARRERRDSSALPNDSSAGSAGTQSADNDSVFAGRYQLGELLRQTPLTLTYAAVDIPLDRATGITILRPELGTDEAASRLFQAMTSSGAELAHRHIARIDNAGTAPWSGVATPWYAGELITAETIDQHSIRSTPADWPDYVLRVAEQVAAAMQHAHAHAIVHGNLGPNTILLGTDPTGTPDTKIIHFGPQAAELLDIEDPALTTAMWQRFTKHLTYPAPEQTRKRAPSRHSDIFGFGCALAGLLAHTPAGAPRPEPGLAGVNVDILHELEKLASDTMNEAPTRRPGSFLEIQEQLRWLRTAHHLDRQHPTDPTPTATLPSLPVTDPAPKTDIIPVITARSTVPGTARQGRRPASPAAKLTLILSAGVLVTALGSYWAVTGQAAASTPHTLTVPAVTTDSLADATTTLTAAGITIAGQRNQPDPSLPANTVTGTDPAAGSTIPTNQPVTILLSTGSAPATIPQLRGMTLTGAQTALHTANLTAGTISPEDGPAPAGTILRSEPDFGTILTTGATVNLSIASGNQTIPDHLTGQAEAPQVFCRSYAGCGSRLRVA